MLFRNTRHTIKGFPEREVHAYPLKVSAHWQIKYELSEPQSNQPPQHLLSPELGFLADDANFNWTSGDERIKWLAEFLQKRISEDSEMFHTILIHTHKYWGTPNLCYISADT